MRAALTYIPVQRSIPNILFSRCAFVPPSTAQHSKHPVQPLRFCTSMYSAAFQTSCSAAALLYLQVQRSIPNILFGRFEPTTSGGAVPAQDAGGQRSIQLS